MTDRVVETQLRFITDRQATNQVLRDNARIDDSLQEIDDTASRLEDAYSDMERAAIKTAKAQREASEQSIRAAKEQSELLGDVASRTSQLSGAAAGLGAIGGQRLMIAADILDAAEAAQLLRAEFPAMIAQLVAARSQLLLFGGIGAAFAGAALLMNQYNKEKEREKRLLAETRQSVVKYIERLTELNIFLAGATTDEIQARIEEEQNTLNGLIATRGDIENEFDTMLSNLVNQYSEQFPDIAEQLGQATLENIDDLNLPALQQLNSAMSIFGGLSEKQYDDINLQIGALAELGTQYDGTNQKIEEQTQLIEDLGGAILPTTEFFNVFSDAAFEAGSSGRLVTNTLADLTGGAADAAESFGLIGDKTDEMLAKVTGARDEETSAILETLKAEMQRQDVITAGATLIAKAEQQRADVIAESEQSILDVQRDTAQKRADAIAKTESDIADLASDYAKQRADIERDRLEKIADLTGNYQKDSLRDLEDFNREQTRATEDHREAMLDAAGRLDAIALLDEQRSFTKDQKRADEDFKTEQKRRDEEFKAQLKQADDAAKREQQQALANYRQRETDLRNSLNKQLSDLRTAQQREIMAIQSAQQQKIATINSGLENELRQLTGFTQNEIMIRDDHYTAMLSQLESFVSEANATMGNLRVSSPTVTTGGGGIIPNTPGAVGQFPLTAARGFTSPLASPAAMLPPVSRSVSTVNNAPNVTNNFSGMDRLTPGQIRNVVRIVNDEMLRALA